MKPVKPTSACLHLEMADMRVLRSNQLIHCRRPDTPVQAGLYAGQLNHLTGSEQ
jgi:hypothetical protein